MWPLLLKGHSLGIDLSVGCIIQGKKQSIEQHGCSHLSNKMVCDTCMSTHMCTRMHAYALHTHTCAHAHTRIAHARTHTHCTHVHTRIVHAHTRMCTRTHTHALHTHACVAKCLDYLETLVALGRTGLFS